MKTEYLLADIACYLLLIPCLIGIKNWHYFSLAMKIYLLFLVANFIIGILSIIYSEMNLSAQFYWPLSAANNSFWLGLFYTQLIQKKSYRYLVILGFSVSLLYIIIDFLTAGIQLINLKIFYIPTILNLFLSMLLIKGLLFQSISLNNNPLFWVLTANAVLAISGLILNYFLERLPINYIITSLLTLIIMPIVDIIGVSLLIYAFILSKRAKTLFNRIPDLDSKP